MDEGGVPIAGLAVVALAFVGAMVVLAALADMLARSDAALRALGL